jgi:hypothetical protein
VTCRSPPQAVPCRLNAGSSSIRPGTSPGASTSGRSPRWRTADAAPRARPPPRGRRQPARPRPPGQDAEQRRPGGVQDPGPRFSRSDRAGLAAATARTWPTKHRREWPFPRPGGPGAPRSDGRRRRDRPAGAKRGEGQLRMISCGDRLVHRCATLGLKARQQHGALDLRAGHVGRGTRSAPGVRPSPSTGGKPSFDSNRAPMRCERRDDARAWGGGAASRLR